MKPHAPVSLDLDEPSVDRLSGWALAGLEQANATVSDPRALDVEQGSIRRG